MKSDDERMCKGKESEQKIKSGRWESHLLTERQKNVAGCQAAHNQDAGITAAH